MHLMMDVRMSWRMEHIFLVSFFVLNDDLKCHHEIYSYYDQRIKKIENHRYRHTDTQTETYNKSWRLSILLEIEFGLAEEEDVHQFKSVMHPSSATNSHACKIDKSSEIHCTMCVISKIKYVHIFILRIYIICCSTVCHMLYTVQRKGLFYGLITSISFLWMMCVCYLCTNPLMPHIPCMYMWWPIRLTITVTTTAAKTNTQKSAHYA